ncbi:MAG TPA: segregation/condensation protein A [Thermodesulfobacteriota bacterium]|nr:segregation/condensation protein A [Thermodesulfobacteriota bacterium]
MTLSGSDDKPSPARNEGDASASPVGDVPLRLDVFEGPLDILLHLVRDQKLDINDIPIAKITEQYLAYLDLMQALNLEVAGEFLVMASTLVHIKSKSLLPRHGDEEEEEDPEIMRNELSRRLIEYERFKEAAARLGERPVLGRDVFVRDFLGEEIPGEELVITELSMADLITAFKDALSRMPVDAAQEFFVERITIADAIAFLLDRLKDEGSIRFEDIVAHCASRNEIVSFFLGILELVRLKTIRVYQANPLGLISIVPAVRETENGRDTEIESADGE